MNHKTSKDDQVFTAFLDAVRKGQGPCQLHGFGRNLKHLFSGLRVGRFECAHWERILTHRQLWSAWAAHTNIESALNHPHKVASCEIIMYDPEVTHSYMTSEWGTTKHTQPSRERKPILTLYCRFGTKISDLFYLHLLYNLKQIQSEFGGALGYCSLHNTLVLDKSILNLQNYINVQNK